MGGVIPDVLEVVYSFDYSEGAKMSGARSAAGSVAVMSHREHSHSPRGSVSSPVGSSESFGETEANVSVALFSKNTWCLLAAHSSRHSLHPNQSHFCCSTFVNLRGGHTN